MEVINEIWGATIEACATPRETLGVLMALTHVLEIHQSGKIWEELSYEDTLHIRRDEPRKYPDPIRMIELAEAQGLQCHGLRGALMGAVVYNEMVGEALRAVLDQAWKRFVALKPTVDDVEIALRVEVIAARAKQLLEDGYDLQSNNQ